MIKTDGYKIEVVGNNIKGWIARIYNLDSGNLVWYISESRDVGQLFEQIEEKLK